MIGASPNTEWLRSTVDLDQKGLVRTGSAKKAASAAGEEAIAIAAVNVYLSEQREF
jgi:alkyl hydroperoxide reductase subunit AhpF